jgi:sugar phosphate permease
MPPRASRARFVVVIFMVLLAMVTYLDRACIGAMAPRISEEFGLDEAQMSWVFFAFILSYAIFEIRRHAGPTDAAPSRCSRAS